MSELEVKMLKSEVVSPGTRYFIVREYLERSDEPKHKTPPDLVIIHRCRVRLIQII
jgi:hypothetical protein